MPNEAPGQVAPVIPADENLRAESNAASDRRLVLLVSDDPLMARALTRLLRKAGYDVVSCEGGCLAPGNAHAALVIVDVPDEGISKLGTHGYRPPGRSDEPSVLWIGDPVDLERRRDGHLAKPFTGNQLLSKVESLLRD